MNVIITLDDAVFQWQSERHGSHARSSPRSLPPLLECLDIRTGLYTIDDFRDIAT
jgi:hypothetical protein